MKIKGVVEPLFFLRRAFPPIYVKFPFFVHLPRLQRPFSQVSNRHGMGNLPDDLTTVLLAVEKHTVFFADLHESQALIQGDLIKEVN